MHDSGVLIARIHDQFNRLSCEEIHFSAAPGCMDGIFRRGDEASQLRLDLALRSLFPLLSHSGDAVAWQALKVAGENAESTELPQPESR